ncbi:MAG: ABC transporter ATP-binding protein [Bacteroidales bacterium]
MEPAKTDILTLHNVAIGYWERQHKTVFEQINLSASEGELVALIGKNGVGKSTLLRTIARLQPPLSGAIHFRGEELNAYSRHIFARLLSFVSTEIVNIPNLSVFDFVALGRSPYTNWFGRLEKRDKQATLRAIAQVGMSHMARNNLTEISDGERQRIMVARTLAQDTPFILLDEPTAFLDLPNRYEIIHLLHELAREQNKTILFSTHDLSIALQEADKIWLLNREELHEGAPEDLILNNSFEQVFRSKFLTFDRRRGDFFMPKTLTSSVVLNNPDRLDDYWLRKALTRIGVAISADASLTTPHLSITLLSNEPFACKLYFPDKQEEYIRSFYHLNRLVRSFIDN